MNVTPNTKRKLLSKYACTPPKRRRISDLRITSPFSTIFALDEVEEAEPPSCSRSPFMSLPVDLIKLSLGFFSFRDLTVFAVTCHGFNQCTAEFVLKQSSFDFLESFEVTRLLVLLTSSWSTARINSYCPTQLETWKAILIKQRGFPFWISFPDIQLGDAAPLVDSLDWEPSRHLGGCRSHDQLVARAKARCQKLSAVVGALCGVQFALIREDLDYVLQHVRTLPIDPTLTSTPLIANGPQLLLRLRDYFNHIFAPVQTIVSNGAVTLDQCRTLLLKVCRKVLVRLRPSSPEMVLSVRLFRKQLTDCVRCYGMMPQLFEDTEVARGLVKLIRKSRLYFVDQCGNPACGKSERIPQEHKRCSACAWVKYCSKECQRADWAIHKETCQVLHEAIYAH
eukprot:NODE_1580_length_1451_cov_50.721299_g1499_i0.p1 GENE.NODE_1580_length_1451_cov_50.721299_g1499_i0~~NODE_1580_length_1451_cov_50.721299_g1499_i0.p1  ORF type:complete len:395 (+),score=50.16 NODE_1580_length_1451_cov_50.721299_g1499_i0:70-1254(+)